jgi:anti-anti-sigma regulatory factor
MLGEVGGELKLCCLTERVTAAFSLIRMDRILDIFANREDATQAFARNPNQG